MSSTGSTSNLEVGFSGRRWSHRSSTEDRIQESHAGTRTIHCWLNRSTKSAAICLPGTVIFSTFSEDSCQSLAHNILVVPKYKCHSERSEHAGACQVKYSFCRFHSFYCFGDGSSNRTMSHCWVWPSAKCTSAGAESSVRLAMPVSMIGRVLPTTVHATRCDDLLAMPSIG
jgi:hypothetical protein